ncbi:MAG: hypothetical protein M9962_10095 [Oligoflexia bacterium]|nr:hypothetical protein [Oligoflexia bacterium]
MNKKNTKNIADIKSKDADVAKNLEMLKNLEMMEMVIDLGLDEKMKEEARKSVLQKGGGSR